MTPDEFRGQLEAEFSWRQQELLSLQNLRAKLEADEPEEVLNKSLLLMLYAHYEGFVKFCFDHYARVIGEVGPRAGDVSYALAAAAMAEIFHLLRDSTKKSALFRNELPADNRLHLLAREAEFLERIQHFQTQVIAKEQINVDTESNLSMSVLRRNLFVLGLNPDQFESHRQPLSEMVERRHKLAHGAERAGLETEKYDRCRNAVFYVMKEMMVNLTDAVVARQWMRSA
ncbi:MAE_28990/MAE_18760 family HEPN-like nuclease [Reyranella sp.]|uniref:MAE_28990/MAE_18760 family HEPN-like nuclease n=1 Tax=Reyranella sp. TaxID=1929291 RepID=UPI003BAB726D